MNYVVDTNVIIRYLTNDDPVQERIAQQTLRAGFLLTASVLMECEWVLRSAYRWPHDRIAQSLSDLIDLPSVVSFPEGTPWALDRFARGADLADMIHLITGVGASAFATFDLGVAKMAGPGSPLPVETLA